MNHCYKLPISDFFSRELLKADDFIPALQILKSYSRLSEQGVLNRPGFQAVPRSANPHLLGSSVKKPQIRF